MTDFKVIEEGFTLIEMSNGNKLKFKTVVGSIDMIEGRKNPDGTQMYSINHQMVSFVIPNKKPTIQDEVKTKQ